MNVGFNVMFVLFDIKIIQYGTVQCTLLEPSPPLAASKAWLARGKHGTPGRLEYPLCFSLQLSVYQDNFLNLSQINFWNYFFRKGYFFRKQISIFGNNFFYKYQCLVKLYYVFSKIKLCIFVL